MFYFVVTQYKFLAHANLEALLKSAERTETTGVHINAAITIKQTFHLKKKTKTSYNVCRRIPLCTNTKIKIFQAVILKFLHPYIFLEGVSPEEGFTGLTGDSIKVTSESAVATDAADLLIFRQLHLLPSDGRLYLGNLHRGR